PWVDVPDVSLGKTQAATRMRLGYDDKNLYVAFLCEEPKMDEMVVKEYGHDGPVFNTECVEIFLAPDGVGQKRVQICVSPTPQGRWEGRYGYIDDPLDPIALSGKPDVSWNPQYRTAYRIDRAAKKWTVEIAMPFEELGVSAPALGTRWRGNFGRERHLRLWDPKKYDGQSEYSLWSPNLQGATFTDPAAFGDIYFGAVPPEGK
ncbi:MAG TPA: carbohydrate-binding family 9-like protein, partial [Candidatus Brocadiia bacterium]|nr:carbohydrate-binding family 9-like protein [Candidatus Brocadiia bacterium]